MEPIYVGKTKNLYELENGNLLLKFKDDVTGKDGIFDPGENQVGLSIDGIGKKGLEMTKFFFEKLKEKDIPTHYVNSDIENGTMEVIKANPFGHGLEFICRFKAVGSFYKRFNKYIEEGSDLDSFFEVTIKDDEAKDPVISEDIVTLFNIMTSEQYNELKILTKKICNIIKLELKEFNLDLYDIKLEFGLTSEGKILLIDEISGGNMRVYRNKEYIEPLELYDIIFNSQK